MLNVLRRSLTIGIAIATFGVNCQASEPWTSTWTMDLRGEERVMVEQDGKNFLLISHDDFQDPAFLHRKDVALLVKFAGSTGQRPMFYRLDGLRISADPQTWASAADGDNLWLLGHMTRTDTDLLLTVTQAIAAPSDAQIIQERLAQHRQDAYAARLDVAAWAREQADLQGNRQFWLDASRTIVTDVVRTAARSAAAAEDFDLLVQAMQWALDHGRLLPLAADIGSAAWARSKTADNSSQAGPEDIAALMNRLGHVYYQGEDDGAWMPVVQALQRQYERRFTALDWRDAEGFYQLGRWADQHADILTNARELSHRAYQAGHQANPNHNGIRRALGMDPVAEEIAGVRAAQTFTDTDTGVSLSGPELWYRNAQPIDHDADATWYDPGSDTAYLALRLRQTPSSEAAAQIAWQQRLADVGVRRQFTTVGDSHDLRREQLRGRRIEYAFTEGEYRRFETMVMLYQPQGTALAWITVSYLDAERAAALTALDQALASLVIPQQGALDEDDDDDAAVRPDEEEDQDPTPPDQRFIRPIQEVEEND